jgi:hypothetical protein
MLCVLSLLRWVAPDCPETMIASPMPAAGSFLFTIKTYQG